MKQAAYLRRYSGIMSSTAQSQQKRQSNIELFSPSYFAACTLGGIIGTSRSERARYLGEGFVQLILTDACSLRPYRKQPSLRLNVLVVANICAVSFVTHGALSTILHGNLERENADCVCRSTPR